MKRRRSAVNEQPETRPQTHSAGAEPGAAKSGRLRLVLPWVLAAVATTAVASWALYTMVKPAPTNLGANYTYAEVTEGSVGSVLQLDAIARWEPVPVAGGNPAGVITEVFVTPGQTVDAGAALFSVALRPVVVAQGEVPMFRSLAEGAEGRDVTQLQLMLQQLGHYPAGETTGKYDWVTVRAVNSWQQASGAPVTGQVNESDLIFLPQLPARIWIDTEKVRVGAALTGGAEIVGVYGATPKIYISAGNLQASLMPPGTGVELSWQDTTWEGITAEHQPDTENNNTNVTITGPDGAPICGDSCAELPFDTYTRLPARIITVPETTGLVVPSAAITSNANGETAVITKAGKRIPVTVTQQAKGMSLITGVKTGTVVRIPAKDNAATADAVGDTESE